MPKSLARDLLRICNSFAARAAGAVIMLPIGP
jgi:hypothetical protein